MLLVNDFFDTHKELENSNLPKRIRVLSQRINRLKNNFNREMHKIKQQRQSDRKARTRQLIQIGGLVHKSGLVDAFLITPKDDLQDYETRTKAVQLFGFLITCFEENN